MEREGLLHSSSERNAEEGLLHNSSERNAEEGLLHSSNPSGEDGAQDLLPLTEGFLPKGQREACQKGGGAVFAAGGGAIIGRVFGLQRLSSSESRSSVCQSRCFGWLC